MINVYMAERQSSCIISNDRFMQYGESDGLDHGSLTTCVYIQSRGKRTIFPLNPGLQGKSSLCTQTSVFSVGQIYFSKF